MPITMSNEVTIAEINDYTFEGKLLSTEVPEDVLDRLAGIAISYKILSKDRVTKAAKEQRSFFKGVLYGLEVSEVITSEDKEVLYAFFIGD